jgi:hypothetical protein
VTDPRDVVAAKRDGRKLDPDELRAFVLAYARSELPDYLAAAFLMAAFINGLDAEETLALTRAMVDSGQTFRRRYHAADGGKHSTGGVADGVTLVFTPHRGVARSRRDRSPARARARRRTPDSWSRSGARTDLIRVLRTQIEQVGSAVATQTDDIVRPTAGCTRCAMPRPPCRRSR